MSTRNDVRPSPHSSLFQRLLQAAGRMLLACIDTYALGLLVYFVLRLVTGFRLAPVAMFSNFLQFALLPALVLLPIVLVLRRWRRAILVALPALAFLWLYGGLFLPSTAATADCRTLDCVKLTVMTLNLGDGILVGGSTEVPPAAIMKVLMESGADVAGFQEVTAAQAEAMQGQMSSEYPYLITHEAGKGVSGIALLSRYPILEWTLFYGDPPVTPNLNAILDVQGWPVYVLVTHPPPPAWSLNRQLAYQARAMEEVRLYTEIVGNQPAVLLGDMNSTDQSEEYAILTGAGLVDAYREAGFGFGSTYPSHSGYGLSLELPIPLVRVDYIFHTPHFTALRAWVGPDVESDHLPVLAELVWQRER